MVVSPSHSLYLQLALVVIRHTVAIETFQLGWLLDHRLYSEIHLVYQTQSSQ